MARPRKNIPNLMVLEMAEVISKILTKNDAEIGAWFRKAASDVMNGCKDPNCDPIVRRQFEHALQELRKRQEKNAAMYRNRLAREGKSITASINDQVPAEVNTTTCNTPTTASATVGSKTDKFNGDATTGGGVEVYHSSESCSLELTTISNISQDAPNGNAGDANLVHPAPIAESARCATSEAVKALADASTREGEDERDHRGNTGTLESSTSAKILKLETEGRKSQLTGGAPERCKRSTASHAEKLPVSTPADSSEEKKPYGTCKHVMLTDAEGRHLREVYGNNLSVAIDILDAYIENGGKAAKKYKNHAAVLRKGNWVYEKVQTMALNEKRIENASKGLKNWKAEERERTARVLRGESADGKNYVRDEELSPAELEAKYA